MDAVETGVLSEEGCGKEAQDFEFWHFFHEDQIQSVVFGIRFRAELKAATLVGRFMAAVKNMAGTSTTVASSRMSFAFGQWERKSSFKAMPV